MMVAEPPLQYAITQVQNNYGQKKMAYDEGMISANELLEDVFGSVCTHCAHTGEPKGIYYRFSEGRPEIEALLKELAEDGSSTDAIKEALADGKPKEVRMAVSQLMLFVCNEAGKAALSGIGMPVVHVMAAGDSSMTAASPTAAPGRKLTRGSRVDSKDSDEGPYAVASAVGTQQQTQSSSAPAPKNGCACVLL